MASGTHIPIEPMVECFTVPDGWTVEQNGVRLATYRYTRLHMDAVFHAARFANKLRRIELDKAAGG